MALLLRRAGGEQQLGPAELERLAGVARAAAAAGAACSTSSLPSSGNRPQHHSMYRNPAAASRRAPTSNAAHGQKMML